MSDEFETTEVLICGCGPTGAMLAGYLGKAGVHTVILEKEPGITTDPRGIALDADGIRLVQGLGLYEHIFSDIGACIAEIRFVGGAHHDLNKSPIMCLDTSATSVITGHVGAICHKQPVLEKHLRSKIIGDVATCDLRSSSTLTAIREDENWVYATYEDDSGTEKVIRSKFLVGADGKTGFVRKKYLEPRGVQLLWAERTKYQESWVAMNWKITLPTPETHPAFPLWHLGYTPQQVYDLFFPAEFRFLCNPNRPAVCGRFGLPSDRLWRFEFLVTAGEVDTQMAEPAMIDKVVFPYLTHPGHLYGLAEDIKYPSDCIEVLRCRPFRFSARSCNKWALGRVVLCGDAAHVFPPFGGQGIASGFRDAASLSWRLILASRSENVDINEALEGWYLERKQQLEASLASTVRNGDLVSSRNPIKNFIRDWSLWLLQLVPSIKSQIQQGPDVRRMQYKFETGMAFMADLGGGGCFSQTYCVAINSTAGAALVRFTDDVIFAAEKKSLLQIVVLMGDLSQLDQLRSDIDGLAHICPLLCPAEASFFIRRQDLSSSQTADATQASDVFRTATADEFGKSALCVGRPHPRGYEEHDMWQGVPGKTFVILRPDRFVFAACKTRKEIEQAARRLEELFPQ